MSVDIAAKIREKIFSVDNIKKSLCNFFKCTVNIDRMEQNKYKFTCFYENDDIILFLIDNNKYQSWDSVILNKDFPYLQSLIFDISKFSNLNKNFETILRFLIELQMTSICEVLVTSSIHDEICYINIDSKVIWSNNCGYLKNLVKYND